MREKEIIDKKAEKKIVGKCVLCEENNQALLDVHRIEFGSKGGKYTRQNSLVTCCACHRKIHAGQITIDRKYNSTDGPVVRYFEGGEEKWAKA